MKIKIIKKKLNNGLRFIHAKNKSKNIMLKVSVKVGSQNETKENNGISHFLEHMVWQGSKNYTAEDIRKQLKELNANFNASTSFNITTHFIFGPRRYFEKYVKILLDVIQNPLFTEEDIERERKIILDEYTRVGDGPRAILQKSIISTLFKNHTLSQLPIGTQENIKKINRKQLIEYYKKHYVAKNMIISVTGDLEKPEKIIKKYLNLKEGNETTTKKLSKPVLTKNKIVNLKEGIKATHVSLTFLTPSYEHKDNAYVEIINFLLENGVNISLTETIRQKLGLTYNINAKYYELMEANLLSINTTTNPNQIDELVTAIFSEIKKFENLKVKELKRAKQKILKTYKFLDKLSFFLIDRLILEEFFNFNINKNKIEYIKNASVEDIKNTVNKYFNNYLLTIVEPREKAISS